MRVPIVSSLSLPLVLSVIVAIFMGMYSTINVFLIWEIEDTKSIKILRKNEDSKMVQE